MVTNQTLSTVLNKFAKRLPWQLALELIDNLIPKKPQVIPKTSMLVSQVYSRHALMVQHLS